MYCFKKFYYILCIINIFYLIFYTNIYNIYFLIFPKLLKIIT